LAFATNHFLHIKEVMAGANGDSRVQFIVIEREGFGQNAWGPNGGSDSRAMLVFFDATGRETGKFKFPANPPAGGPVDGLSGTNFTLIATQQFANLPGAPAPDILISPLLNPISGKVCFTNNPANTVFLRNECLSYGSFTGSTESDEFGTAFGPPAAALPIVNAVSLKRSVTTSHNSDFSINTTPTPINMAGLSFPMAVATQTAQGQTLFNRETFLGNGRTCGQCHVSSASGRLPPDNVQSRFAALASPTLSFDPLFIAETAPSSFDPGFDFNLNILELTGPPTPGAPTCTGDLAGVITSGAAGSRAKVFTRVSPTA
jgi:hypothetical protein